jgi:hypothetical protein
MSRLLRRWVARIRAEMAEEGFEPYGRDVELLSLAEQLADRIGEWAGGGYFCGWFDVDVEGRSCAFAAGRGLRRVRVRWR